MHLVCPKACDEVRKQCANNTDCRMMRETIFKECQNVFNWDGNSTKPNCTDGCMEWVHNREKHPIMKQLKCCIDDEDDEIDIGLMKISLETLCGTKLDSSEECQNKRKACEHIRAKEDSLDHPGKHRT